MTRSRSGHDGVPTVDNAACHAASHAQRDPGGLVVGEATKVSPAPGL